MPSLRHRAITTVLPRFGLTAPVGDADEERDRIVRGRPSQPLGLPIKGTGRFERRFELTTETLPRPAGDFSSYVFAPRGVEPELTIYHLHGGSYTSGLHHLHTTYAGRLARALGARVVLPDYPLAPEHTWQDSHDALVDDLARRTAAGPVVLTGDSAGGGMAMAVAAALRDRGAPPPTHMVLVSPWGDSTVSTPDTREFQHVDPWLSLSKLELYSQWWAGSREDLGRAEVSPALHELHDLPPTLMFCGTRDLLVFGCRLIAERAAAAGWDLTYVEPPGLIHIYPLLPYLPEARKARKQTLEFLRKVPSPQM
jgi:monoterpene epsilon-lactone hydrolase